MGFVMNTTHTHATRFNSRCWVAARCAIRLLQSAQFSHFHINENQTSPALNSTLAPSCHTTATMGDLDEELTEAQLAEFQRCFEEFDVDNSGSIDVDELKALMQSFGHK